MPRAIWSGAISLGMVSIPVRLFPATRKRDLRFRELDRVTGRRIHHERVRHEPAHEAPPHEAPAISHRALEQDFIERPLPREVAAEEVVKGYEVSPGRFVAVEREELTELEPERSRTIDVELFVDSDAVDPVYYDAAYHAVPNLDHVRPFAVLQDALREEKRIGICWVVLRTRRHLAALRPYGEEGLLLSTLYFADEVLAAPGPSSLAGAALTDRERQMARLLVQTLTGPFDPAQFRDEYRERVLQMIGERSAHAVEVAERPPEPAASSVEDLLTALRASIEQAKAQTADRRRARGA
jgi:DNA end-binding protein Ku